MENLPLEILVDIGFYLQIKDFPNYFRISKLFSCISKTPGFWSQLLKIHFPRFRKMVDVEKFPHEQLDPQKCTYEHLVKHLYLSSQGRIPVTYFLQQDLAMLLAFPLAEYIGILDFKFCLIRKKYKIIDSDYHSHYPDRLFLLQEERNKKGKERNKKDKEGKDQGESNLKLLRYSPVTGQFFGSWFQEIKFKFQVFFLDSNLEIPKSLSYGINLIPSNLWDDFSDLVIFRFKIPILNLMNKYGTYDEMAPFWPFPLDSNPNVFIIRSNNPKDPNHKFETTLKLNDPPENLSYWEDHIEYIGQIRRFLKDGFFNRLKMILSNLKDSTEYDSNQKILQLLTDFESKLVKL